MVEWSEDPVAVICPFKLEPWNMCLMSGKMETGRGQLWDQWNTQKGRARRVLWLF
jgi:hypothetical protein